MRTKILITGAESTGSVLCAKTIAKAIDYNCIWDGYGKHEINNYSLYHVSMPTGKPPKFPYVAFDEYDYIVICTRDVNVSILSKKNRFKKSREQCESEMSTAKYVLTGLMHNHPCYFIFNYETFMYLGYTYLHILYNFLGIKSTYMPKLNDGNKKYISEC